MIVCLCKVTTDRDVAAAVADGARTVEDIGRACGAGTGCGTCKPLIAGLIDRYCPTSGEPCSGCDRMEPAEQAA